MNIELLKQELQFVFGDKLDVFLGTSIEKCDDSYIEKKFNEYAKEHATFVRIKDVVDNYQDTAFLVNTPDGFQEISDFYIKGPKPIYDVNTLDLYTTKCSNDHKFQTDKGWKFAEDLSIEDSLLTKEGYRKISTISKSEEELVYDFEVLHDNHRYWSGNGLSSHNTGKTYVACSIVRSAQQMDYFPIYYDSEGSIDVDFVKKLGIDTTKFRLENVNTIEEFATLTAKLNDTISEIKKSGKTPPKIMVVLDSLGNLSSTKEKEDTASGSGKRDMTKQQSIRRMFRVIGNDFAKNGIPFIINNHTYACVHGDTEVLLDSGEYKQIKDIRTGEYVVTLNGSKEVLDTFRYDIEHFVELEFGDGTKLQCTHQHKFKSVNGEWVRAEDLNEGSKILLVNQEEITILSTKEKFEDLVVYDIEVADEHHYILKNGVISHNSIGSYIPGQTISGGGGAMFNASIIFTLTKSKLTDKDSEEHIKKHGIEATKIGIVVTIHPFKQRFARPIKVQIHIPFYKKPNPFVGLEKFVSWETCGIVRGKAITEKEYGKLTPAEQKKCYPMQIFDVNDSTKPATSGYAMPRDTSRSLVCKHLGGEIPISELYTEKVFTQEVLQELDDNIIKKTFSLPSIESLEDLAEVTGDLLDDMEMGSMNVDNEDNDNIEVLDELLNSTED